MDTERKASLATLLIRVEAPIVVVGDRERMVRAIETDSRSVKAGALFVALRGSHSDGHLHVAEAVENGARTVVVEAAPPTDLPADVTIAYVPDSRRALSALAAAFYGDPSGALNVIGITGTNGKTTTTHLIGAILNAAGIPCGVAGTVGAEFRSRGWPLVHTTPLPPVLHALLAEMLDEGANAVAMEVSSHALALDRVDDVRFRVAGLTNVTRDHLDFHETFDAYAASKRRLFTLTNACVLNVDDTFGARWARELAQEGREVLTYGIDEGAMLRPLDLSIGPNGSRFTVLGQRYELRLAGRFNVWNALAALGIARFFGIDDATSARGLASVERIAGRMERLAGGGVAVVVDYAHTPDALENALHALHETTDGALAVVFGCGGDRDRGKRAEMGAVAARYAQRLYVTSDNPRSEEPQAIVGGILAGVGNHEHVVELDRRRAITRAVAEANPGDVVLVAGKGHETYQIVGNRVLPFDDVAIARDALRARSVLQ